MPCEFHHLPTFETRGKAALRRMPRNGRIRICSRYSPVRAQLNSEYASTSSGSACIISTLENQASRHPEYDRGAILSGRCNVQSGANARRSFAHSR